MVVCQFRAKEERRRSYTCTHNTFGSINFSVRHALLHQPGRFRPPLLSGLPPRRRRVECTGQPGPQDDPRLPPRVADVLQNVRAPVDPLCETYNFRCIASDRRGFGSSHWNGPDTKKPVDWDTLLTDVISLLQHLEIQDFIFVAASMGCTESLLAYQSSKFIEERCKGLVWLGAIMPFPLQTAEHPLSPSLELWDSIVGGLRDNRAAFVSESLPGVFAIQAGNEIHPKTLEHFERIVAEADSLAVVKTVEIFNQPAEAAVKKLAESAVQIPILAIHGDADQGMPLEASAQIVKEMVPWVDLKVYEKAGHGLYLTHSGQLMEDLVSFFRQVENA
ncbi:unnamed protein product [Parascedosporium putredinis]|uniref:AB hydrolase-1 domain-containing protein n=1 Tax=Parascedosporium putredinis TaxID=1442378 RepID=A0A9P1M8H0_9PEZI|nr:unnamed protein product [Parascedosporium putredinis]CAI7989928.1 unnamed protein product [Parascedosporium putredinis]